MGSEMCIRDSENSEVEVQTCRDGVERSPRMKDPTVRRHSKDSTVSGSSWLLSATKSEPSSTETTGRVPSPTDFTNEAYWGYSRSRWDFDNVKLLTLVHSSLVPNAASTVSVGDPYLTIGPSLTPISAKFLVFTCSFSIKDLVALH